MWVILRFFCKGLAWKILCFQIILIVPRPKNPRCEHLDGLFHTESFHYRCSRVSYIRLAGLAKLGCLHSLGEQLYLPFRVTRFGEFSPLWQNPLSLWQYFEGIISNWQKYKTDLVNFVCFWANFQCYKWTNIEI